MTTFALSSANANIWRGSGVAAALSLALVYGGLAQLLAGMWEFVRKNTFAALAFTSYGAFWLGFWLLLHGGPVPLGSDTVGIYLLGWTIFTAYMTIAALRVNMAVLSVFVFLTATFVFLTIGNWNAGHVHLVHIGGWLGIITAALAWYASAAGVINETHGKVLLPVGPRS
jgi:hypothetical protein